MLADRPPRRHARRLIIGLAAAAMVIAACGSDDDSAPASEVDAEPTATDAPGDAESQDVQQNGPVTVEGTPLQPFDDQADDPAVGTAAPVITGESFDGTPITIGEPTENPTMVVFLAHWCPHCNDEIPELLTLAESGDLPEGLDVVGVSTAVEEGADNFPPSEWIDEKGWEWPTMADDEKVSAITAIGGTSFPFTVVLDTDGTVLARRAGQASAEETLLFLDDALAQSSAA